MVIYMVYELMSSRNCSFHYIHKYRCQLILMTPHYLENHICYMTKLWDWVWLPDNIWPVIPWAICSSQLYWPPLCATCWLSYLSSHISRQLLTKITAKRCKWFYSIYHNRQIIRFSLAQTNQSSWPWTNIKADEYEFYNSITCIIYYMYCTYWHGDFHRKHLHSEKETRMKEDCHCI